MLNIAKKQVCMKFWTKQKIIKNCIYDFGEVFFALEEDFYIKCYSKATKKMILQRNIGTPILTYLKTKNRDFSKFDFSSISVSKTDLYEFFVVTGIVGEMPFLFLLGTEYFLFDLKVAESLGHIMQDIVSAKLVGYKTEESTGYIIIQSTGSLWLMDVKLNSERGIPGRLNVSPVSQQRIVLRRRIDF